LIVIHAELKTGRYRYLWLKRVRGFDPSRHCARCLIGDYDRAIRFGSKYVPGFSFTAEIPPDAAPFVYLCGVTSRWADNLHVAILPAAGAAFEYEDANIRVAVVGAERLAIPMVDLPLPEAFATCRNYQFGRRYLTAADHASTIS